MPHAVTPLTVASKTLFSSVDMNCTFFSCSTSRSRDSAVRSVEEQRAHTAGRIEWNPPVVCCVSHVFMIL